MTETETENCRLRSGERVLQLDVAGTPQAWISLAHAALHVARDAVAWVGGDQPLAVLYGGTNARTQQRSRLELYPIMAVKGSARINLFDVPPAVTREKLARRDRHTCAYCGEVFAERHLQCEHILPASRGGAFSWMNLVAACGPCNRRKADRTPDEAGMPLRYLPYVPSRYEDFLLAGRNIRADVHEWLAVRLPRHSRWQ